MSFLLMALAVETYIYLMKIMHTTVRDNINGHFGNSTHFPEDIYVELYEFQRYFIEDIMRIALKLKFDPGS
jgi:hypothetical protein